jgi:uncharacterized protein YndB with AHSA1/START domain
MQDIEIELEIPAPPHQVWAVLSDHSRMADWAGLREVVLRHPGDPPPDGLGAIRVVRARGLSVEEEVTRFEPPRRLEYRIVAGLPVRSYRGEVELAEAGGRTRLRWSVRFEPRIPGTGWILRRVLTGTLRAMLEGLEHYPFPARAA